MPVAAAMRRGMALPLLGVAAESLAGAVVVPISNLGRTTPTSISRQWLLLFAVSWVVLSGWALLYALARRLLLGESAERALGKAALAHAPLLLCFGLVTAVYCSDRLNYLYSAGSISGDLILQPLAKAYIVLSPALAQLLLWARIRWNSLASVLPVVLLTLAALSLRLWNVNWSLPAQLHPDEYQYTGRAFLMVTSGDPNPHYFKNPDLMIYLLSGLYRLVWDKVQTFHALASLLGMSIEDPRGDYLRVMVARAASALAGTVTIPALYLASKELLGRKVALLSSVFLAVSFLHVRDSHYATNDILATFLLSVSFLFSTRVYTRGRLTDYLLAGAFGGLGTSAKYNVGLFCVAIVAAHLARAAKTQPNGRSAAFHFPLLLSAAAATAGFVAGTPYAILDFPDFLADFRAQYALGSDPWSGQQTRPAPFLYYTSLVQGFGLIPLALAATGLFLAWRRDRVPLAILLATPVLYLIFMFPQRLFFARFAIPLLPYLAVLAGYGIRGLPACLPGAAQNRLVLLLLAAAAAQPLAMSIQSDLLLGRQDTRSLAAAWIEQNTPSDSSVAVEHFAHPDADKLHWDRWNNYQGRSAFVFWPDTLEERAKALSGAYRYVVVSSFGYGPWQLGSGGSSTLPSEYEVLEREGQLLARFGPGYENSDLPYSQDDMYTPFWQLFNRERPGPTVRIYYVP